MKAAFPSDYRQNHVTVFGTQVLKKYPLEQSWRFLLLEMLWGKSPICSLLFPTKLLVAWTVGTFDEFYQALSRVECSA